MRPRLAHVNFEVLFDCDCADPYLKLLQKISIALAPRKEQVVGVAGVAPTHAFAEGAQANVESVGAEIG